MTSIPAIFVVLICCSGSKTPPAAKDLADKEVDERIEQLLTLVDVAAPDLSTAFGTPGTVLKPNPQLGKVITVTGKAANAAMGAIVIAEGVGPYYIEGMQEWTAEFNGQNVSVTGTLKSVKLAPDPTPTPDGGQTHGMFGESLVLAQPQVKLATEAAPQAP